MFLTNTNNKKTYEKIYNHIYSIIYTILFIRTSYLTYI